MSKLSVKELPGYLEAKLRNAEKRIAELEDVLRDMIRYDQWAEARGCNCRVCELKRHVRELLEKPNE